MKKSNLELKQWVQHTSGVVGQVVWIDDDIHSNEIQVNWRHSAFARPDRTINANEVVKYIGPSSFMNKEMMREPELNVDEGNMLVAPYPCYLVSYPEKMSVAMGQLLTSGDADIELMAERLANSMGANKALLMGNNFIERKAYVIHRVMLGILLFGEATLAGNLDKMTAPGAMSEIISRYE